MPISQNDLKPPDHGDKLLAASASTVTGVGSATSVQDGIDDAHWPMPRQALATKVVECYNASTTFLDQNARASWHRSIKAYRNEHFDGSKYKSPEWQHRSKLFRPKTRSAIRKAMDNASKALFSTPDVVKLTAGNEADPIQRASAAIKQELLNYRLDRAKGRAALPWFQISMGACQDARIHGVCVSLQSWKFKQAMRVQMVKEQDEITGEVTTRQEVVPRKITDRPDIELYPPENVLIEPMASWIKPEQNAQWIFLRRPTSVDDVMVLIGEGDSDAPSSVPWIVHDRADVEQMLRANVGSDREQSNAVRRAREGGNDPADTTPKRESRSWVTTCFMRIDGEEYVWWMLNNREFLSEPALVDDVYPWNGGERPVVWGYGSLDSHRILPMSTAEALSPLQQEANDIVNLRLDQMKQVAHPLTKIIRGRNVDSQALLRRGANTQIYVQDHNDIEFDRPPDVPSSAYAESNYINADFDDLAGNFSSGSVQTNRSLNETVGGMRLLAGNAASLGEFDTTVWIQTWVEPVLAQIVKLESFYENDETILTIAGEKAKLLQRFGFDAITDEMLMTETTVTVNVGAGAVDPMQRLQKLQGAGEMVAGFLQREFETGQVKKNPRAIIEEVFGAAGYSDGGERFFEFMDEESGQGGQPQAQQQPDPAQMAAAMQQKAEAEKMAKEAQIAEAKAAQDAALKQAAMAAEIKRKDALAAAEARRKDEAMQAEIARKMLETRADVTLDAERETARHRTADSASLLKELRENRAAERREDREDQRAERADKRQD